MNEKNMAALFSGVLAVILMEYVRESLALPVRLILVSGLIAVLYFIFLYLLRRFKDKTPPRP